MATPSGRVMLLPLGLLVAFAVTLHAGDLTAVTTRLLDQARAGNFDAANAASAMREAGAEDRKSTRLNSSH